MLILIDHYDSFSSTIAYYCRCLGQTVLQVNYDEITIQDIIAYQPQALIFSPGPGHPEEVKNSIEIAQYFVGKLPILGICLGHQMLGALYGAQVIRAPAIKHGKLSAISHTGRALFQDLPQSFQVTRYHSLILDPQLWPQCLEIDAWCEGEGGSIEIMGFSHKALPIYGWQFHPEAEMTQYGMQLFKNFFKLYS